MRNFGGIVVILAVLVVVLIGGNEVTSMFQIAKNEVIQTENDSIEKKEEVLEQKGIDIPEHWDEVINESIVIDAEVIASNEVKQHGFQKTIAYEVEFPLEDVLAYFDSKYHPSFTMDEGYGSAK